MTTDHAIAVARSMILLGDFLGEARALDLLRCLLHRTEQDVDLLRVEAAHRPPAAIADWMFSTRGAHALLGQHPFPHDIDDIEDALRAGEADLSPSSPVWAVIDELEAWAVAARAVLHETSPTRH
jgi:hypothetical protein